MTQDRRTIIALFAIAFGLRVLYAVLLGDTVNPEPATWDYRIANEIHNNLSWIGQPFSGRAPGYPVLLAAVFRLVDAGFWRAILLNAVLGGATVLFVYRIGERRLGTGVGLLAALWLAASLHHAYFSAIVVRDVLTTLLLMWFVYLAAGPFRGMRAAVYSGIVYAWLMHTEPAFVLLAPFVVVAFLARATHHRMLNIQFATLFTVTALVVSTPWTIRNAVVYREPIPVALEVTKYMRPVARIAGWVNEARDAEDQLKRLKHAAPPALRRRARSIAGRAMEFWRVVRVRDSYTEKAWSFRHNATGLLQFGLLLPGFLMGAWMGLRRKNRGAIGLLLLVGAWFAVQLYAGASERDRLPVEPAIALIAMYGYAGAFRAWSAGRARSSLSEPESPDS